MIVTITGLWLLWEILADEVYAASLRNLAKGVGITVVVAMVGYAGASMIGLGLALMGMSRWMVLRQAARLYIEVMRGIPIIVLLLYVAFVFVPFIVWAWNGAGLPEMRTRDVPLLWRAVIALMLAYASFLAEIFRAGLQAVDKGQLEAASALGLTGWMRFRLIRFPQAFRLILPPYGNDFIAMVKDSSLVSVLGVTDITQLAKVTAAGNFRYFETYNVAAYLYLAMTITLSLALRELERRLRMRSGG